MVRKMADGRSRLCLPLLLDGATGTEYMKAGMPSGVCLEQWASEHPQAVRDTIAAYADAGRNGKIFLLACDMLPCF